MPKPPPANTVLQAHSVAAPAEEVVPADRPESADRVAADQVLAAADSRAFRGTEFALRTASATAFDALVKFVDRVSS